MQSLAALPHRVVVEHSHVRTSPTAHFGKRWIQHTHTVSLDTLNPPRLLLVPIGTLAYLSTIGVWLHSSLRERGTRVGRNGICVRTYINIHHTTLQFCFKSNQTHLCLHRNFYPPILTTRDTHASRVVWLSRRVDPDTPLRNDEQQRLVVL